MRKVSVVLDRSAVERVAERLRMLGLFDFVTFPVNPPGDDECLEWYGPDREADWIERAVSTVTARIDTVTAELVSCSVYADEEVEVVG